MAQPLSTSTATPNGATPKTIEYLPDSFYTQFLSIDALKRKPSPIRGLFPLEKTPGLISLLAGKPNSATFPFVSLSFKARSPTNPSEELDLTVDEDMLKQGLQYSDTAGTKPLLDWLTGLQEHYHGRKQGKGWRISVGSGSQDLIYKAVQALVNPGDSVLVESPVYAGVIPMFESLDCEQIEVDTDSQGICSGSLRSLLENWPAGKSKPKVLYTVPYGCNPTGMTATLERRKEVLQLSREHNFLILEETTLNEYELGFEGRDDPYYYLYYGRAPRYPSYFALERTDLPEVGRVLRFDSFSKVLSAGIRIGFASGPTALLNAIDMHTATSNLQSSSLTQAIAVTLLDAWGYEGFGAHTETVASFYREKRDIFERAMKKHLTGLAEWDTPEAGMFFWFKLLLKDNYGEGDSQAIIETNAFNRGVLALPGTAFLPNGRKTAYVRAAFSLTPEEDVDTAILRLKEAILDAKKELNGNHENSNGSC